MILKSYLVEDNLEIIKGSLALFYGENRGQIYEIKKQITNKNKPNKILKYNQDEILGNQDNFYNEIKNVSLFDDKKIFFIDNVNDKILNIIENILPKINNNLVYLFSSLLEKKSKLRIFFEKEKKVDIVPCYQDNEITVKKIITTNLKNYKGLTNSIMNLIVENCNNDRAKIYNELDKIKSYFNNFPLNYIEIEKLLNVNENEDFNKIKDSAILGNKQKTAKLLGNTILEVEKTVLYLSSINQRLSKLKEITDTKDNIEITISKLRPPVFWKDKPTFVAQAKLWDLQKLEKALIKIFEAEIKIKSNSSIEKKVILKKLLIDICNLANAV